jgi:hypothetical protein
MGPTHVSQAIGLSVMHITGNKTLVQYHRDIGVARETGIEESNRQREVNKQER